jgi:hypothetical protein
VKVAINTQPVAGPWGGGNRFVLSMVEALRQRGHQATHLLDPDVDLVVIVDPRARNPQVTFTPAQVLSHLRHRPEAVVVHRINECDERKGTRTMNARLRIANYCADQTVFIASWLADLPVWRRDTPSAVILNGADESVFRRASARAWDGREPLRLVTHHWGANANKGWDVYRQIDALLAQNKWKDRISFTYIGNAPAGLKPQNISVLDPLDGTALAQSLAEHHVYLTASINEPGGMHHVEGAIIGLPLIYRRSGALPEYCTGFGEPFEGQDDVTSALERMIADYPKWKAAMPGYRNTATRMTAAYADLLESLHADRTNIAKARTARRDALAGLLNRITALKWVP